MAVAALALNAAAQNPFEPSFNIACVERITAPAYPELARQRQLEGTVNATVMLSPQAKVEFITTDFAAKTGNVIGILIRTVEDAIRAATYRSACGGKTVSFIFDFKISGPSSPNPRQSVAFGYPNKFWVVTEPIAKLSALK